MSEKMNDLHRGPHEGWCDCDNKISEVCNCLAGSYIDQIEELGRKLGVAIEAMRKAIPEFQWVTNGIQMNEHQHIRLGDAIACLYDALKQIEENK